MAAMEALQAVLLILAAQLVSTDGLNTVRCMAYGATYVSSFDGRVVHLRGSCIHELARTCPLLTSNVGRFTVVIKTHSPDVITYVEVRTDETTARVYPTGHVEVNGFASDDSGGNCKLLAQRVPQGTRLSLVDLDVNVLMNENGLVVIDVPEIYMNHVCGLCGNISGPQRNNSVASTCLDDERLSLKTCQRSDALSALANTDSLCGIFQPKARGSSFSECIAAFPDVASSYYKSCLSDVCLSSAITEEGSGCALVNDCGFDEIAAKDGACRVAEAFAAYCEHNKAPDWSWRANFDCPKKCPSGSRYMRSTSACPLSCSGSDACRLSRTKLSWCSENTDGCACRSGFVWGGSTCVPQKACGCFHKQVYHENGSVWLDAACGEELTCIDGQVSARTFRCPAFALCDRGGKDGGWKCSCIEGFFYDGVSLCLRVCSAGHRPRRDVSDCEPCPVGSYQPESGSTDCLACPLGTVTSGFGSTSASQCVAIDALSLFDFEDSGSMPAISCSNSRCVKEIRVPAVLLPTGVPFGRKRHHRIYVSTNGLITFGARYSGNVPESLQKYTFPYPKIAAFWVRQDLVRNVSLWSLSQYEDGTASRMDQKMANATANSRKKLQLFSRLLHVFGKAPATFRATWALDVKWIKAVSYPSSWYMKPSRGIEETATYEVVLITDGASSFVILHYPKGKLCFSKNNLFRKIFMGFNAGDNETIFDYHSSKDTDADATSLDEQHNTGIPGWWAFKIAGPEGASEKIASSASSKCLSWYAWEIETTLSPIVRYSWSCPCDRVSARNDPIFEFDNSSGCAISLTAHSTYGFYQMCCYSVADGPTSGALVTDDRTGGRPLKYNPLFHPQEHQLHDEQHFQDCCIKSTLCHLFRKLRPADRCSEYAAPRAAAIFGDPHFISFDGLEYTYNSVGEFILISSDKLLAQVRLGRLFSGEAHAPASNGSFLQALTVQAQDSSRVHIEAANEDSAVHISSSDGDVYIRGLSNDSSIKFTRHIGVMLKLKGSDVTIVFENGFAVHVKVIKSFLQVEIYLNDALRNSTRGLLGNCDGNKANDFTLRNGTAIDCLSNANVDRCIHYEFGESWRVNEEDTIMWYRAGSSSQDYTDLKASPWILENLAINKTTDITLCKNERTCIYDLFATGSRELAEETLRASERYRMIAANLGNRSPVIKGGRSVMNVTAGIPVSWSLEILDYDNDEITLLEIDMLPGVDRISPERGKYVYTWTNPSSNAMNHSIRVIAVETSGELKRSPELLTKVRFCDGCLNGGVCAFDVAVAEDSNKLYSDDFILVACDCIDGWSGPRCSVRDDPCSSTPCPYTSCWLNDSVSATYSCSACPNETRDLGEGPHSDAHPDCFDYDECVTEDLACVPETCVNTYGSYFCTCRNGFEAIHNSSNCIVLYVNVAEEISIDWPWLLLNRDIESGGDAHNALLTALVSSWTSIAGVTGISMLSINSSASSSYAATKRLHVIYKLECDRGEAPLDIRRILHQRSILITASSLVPVLKLNKEFYNISWPSYTWPNGSAIIVSCETQSSCPLERCVVLLGVPVCKLQSSAPGTPNKSDEKLDETSTTDLTPVWITIGVLAALASIAGLTCCFVVAVKRRQGTAQLHRTRSDSSSSSDSKNRSTTRSYRLQFPSFFSALSGSSSEDDVQQPTQSAPLRASAMPKAFGPRWPRAYAFRRHSTIPEIDSEESDAMH